MNVVIGFLSNFIIILEVSESVPAIPLQILNDYVKL